MGVALANPHMQEARELQGKLSQASNEEERRVLSRELEITETKRDLADSRCVRQRNYVVITLSVVCHELSISAVQYGYILI